MDKIENLKDFLDFMILSCIIYARGDWHIFSRQCFVKAELRVLPIHDILLRKRLNVKWQKSI
ncbi:MAG: hypothetical protein HFE64_05760 [Lachnospiraceae bacterium]|nr:hypothetical protein [Lachnospiraceae bacterium]